MWLVERLHLAGIVVAGATLAWNCTPGGDAPAVAASQFVVEQLVSPAQTNSAAPQLTAQSGPAILSWIERDGARATLRFAERTASGWSQAMDVAAGQDWFVNWADVPSVIRLANGTFAAHWLQKSAGDTYAYDVRLSFSRDDGKTWTRAVSPHHDGTPTEHGFASLFEVSDSGLGLVWLDGRSMRAGDHEGDHGSMSVRAAVFDATGKQTSETVVDDRVCECCPTAVAVTSEGPIAAFRNRSAEEVRDIYVSRLSGDRWTEPTPVHDDGWKIPACPVNGPALSARDRRVAIAWYTVQQEQGRAFVAFSEDAGRTFGKPIRVDDGGSLGRVDVELLEDGSATASWIEFAEQRAQFRVRRVTRTGERSPAVTIAGIEAGRTGGYPRLALQSDELLLAWTETGSGLSRVRTAVARLPTTAGTR
jgi:hypothetical protein